MGQKLSYMLAPPDPRARVALNEQNRLRSAISSLVNFSGFLSQFLWASSAITGKDLFANNWIGSAQPLAQLAFLPLAK